MPCPVCNPTLCAICGHPVSYAWLTETKVDPLLGESTRELHFECHDREKARLKPPTPSFGIWRKPKVRRGGRR